MPEGIIAIAVCKFSWHAGSRQFFPDYDSLYAYLDEQIVETAEKTGRPTPTDEETRRTLFELMEEHPELRPSNWEEIKQRIY